MGATAVGGVDAVGAAVGTDGTALRVDEGEEEEWVAPWSQAASRGSASALITLSVVRLTFRFNDRGGVTLRWDL